MMLGAACVQQGPAQQQTTPTHQTGQIRGTVRFRGTAPATHTEMNSKTPEVCGHEIPVTRLQLSEGNGVRHAFVYLEGIESSESLRPTASLTIEQKGCAYAPHSMVMTAGAPLEIVNDDPVLHNVRASSLSEDRIPHHRRAPANATGPPPAEPPR